MYVAALAVMLGVLLSLRRLVQPGAAGAHAARTLSFAAMALGWVVLALGRHSLAGMAAGLVLLDVGATVADITGRTILYRLDPAIRARLNTL